MTMPTNNSNKKKAVPIVIKDFINIDPKTLEDCGEPVRLGGKKGPLVIFVVFK
jgi:hypothetical protein